MPRLSITWKKSAIGYAREQRRTVRALGLRSLNQTVVQDDSRVIRGMIKRVQHLVQVVEVDEE
ncbi:MAG: 50S ribosomal protein L30 [Dehalococcoidia bacterium]